MDSVNEVVFRQMSPKITTEHDTYPVDIKSLRYSRLFEAARKTAARRDRVHCHVYAGPDYMSLHHAKVHVPYNLFIGESRGFGKGNFRIKITPICLPDTIIDISYLPGPIPQLASPQWPMNLGWWMKISDENFDIFVPSPNGIKTQELIQRFLGRLLPSQSFNPSEHNLNPVFLNNPSVCRPVGSYHPNAIRLVEQIVDWFIDLE